MKRRWLSVIGILFLLTSIGLAFAYAGLERPTAIDWVTVGLLALVGGLWLIAGEGQAIGPLAWYQSGGIGFVGLGCWFAFQAGTLVPDDPEGIEWLLIASFAVGSLALVFIGVDWIRGGDHIDLSTIEGGPLRGEVAAEE